MVWSPPRWIRIPAILALAVVGARLVAGEAPRRRTTPAACSGWTMAGLPGGLFDVAATPGGAVWLLARSGLYRRGACGWQLADLPPQLWGALRGPGTKAHLWLAADDALWIHAVEADGPDRCAGDVCDRSPGYDVAARLDGATWTVAPPPPELATAEQTRAPIDATGLPAGRRPLTMSGPPDDRWLIAETARAGTRPDGPATPPVLELWHQRGGAWTVERPVADGDPVVALAAGATYAAVAAPRGARILRRSGRRWSDVATETDLGQPHAIALVGRAVWLVADCGAIRQPVGGTADLRVDWRPDCVHQAITTDGDGGVWVGGSGKVLHFDGSNWSTSTLLGEAVVDAIWAPAADDVWVAGWVSVWHWDGMRWSERADGLPPGCTSSTQRLIRALAGTGPDDVWAAGSTCSAGNAQLAHWDGTRWTSHADRFPAAGRLTSLVVRGRNDVWVAGSRIAHWDGHTWTELPRPSVAEVTSFAADATHLWLADDAGALFRLALP